MLSKRIQNTVSALCLAIAGATLMPSCVTTPIFSGDSDYDAHGLLQEKLSETKNNQGYYDRNALVRPNLYGLDIDNKIKYGEILLCRKISDSNLDNIIKASEISGITDNIQSGEYFCLLAKIPQKYRKLPTNFIIYTLDNKFIIANQEYIPEENTNGFVFEGILFMATKYKAVLISKDQKVKIAEGEFEVKPLPKIPIPEPTPEPVTEPKQETPQPAIPSPQTPQPGIVPSTQPATP